MHTSCKNVCRLQSDKLKTEAQDELAALHEQLATVNGQLEVQTHINKASQQEARRREGKQTQSSSNNTKTTFLLLVAFLQLIRLKTELQQRSINHETNVADLCSMQWLTLNNLRNLSQQAQFLENEANRVLDFRKVSVEEAHKPLERSLSTREFYKHNALEFRP